MKRIVVAHFVGLIAGAMCTSGAFKARILTISATNLYWVLLNRAVIGLAVGSIFSCSLLMHLGPSPLPLANFFVNGLFGLTIGFFTTKVITQPTPAAAWATTR